jgi:addiction module HigA family antidote
MAEEAGTGGSETVVGPMMAPAHPGEIVRHDCLEPLGLSVTRAAQVLGVSRKALDNLVNGRAGVSPEMAVRLSAAFGGSPRVWINLQAAYDYAQVRKREAEIRASVQPVRPVNLANPA